MFRDLPTRGNSTHTARQSRIIASRPGTTPRPRYRNPQGVSFVVSHGPITEATATLARANPAIPHFETRQNLFCTSAKLKTFSHPPPTRL